MWVVSERSVYVRTSVMGRPKSPDANTVQLFIQAASAYRNTGHFTCFAQVPVAGVS